MKHFRPHIVFLASSDAPSLAPINCAIKLACLVGRWHEV